MEILKKIIALLRDSRKVRMLVGAAAIIAAGFGYHMSDQEQADIADRAGQIGDGAAEIVDAFEASPVAATAETENAEPPE